MADLRTRNGMGARALEFLILTAARTGAVTGATWAEIDLKEKIWTVPPDRAGTKIDGDKPRRVPLSPRAVELLERSARARQPARIRRPAGRPGVQQRGDVADTRANGPGRRDRARLPVHL